MKRSTIIYGVLSLSLIATNAIWILVVVVLGQHLGGYASSLQMVPFITSDARQAGMTKRESLIDIAQLSGADPVEIGNNVRIPGLELFFDDAGELIGMRRLSLTEELRGQPRADPLEVNGLDETAELYLGKTLYLRSSYGYGWVTPEPDNTPLPSFRFRLESLWTHDDIRRGGIGVIVDEGHPADGMWLIFSTRHQATYDFHTQIGEYNLSIGDSEPRLVENGWPEFETEAKYAGWGQVSDGSQIDGT